MDKFIYLNGLYNRIADAFLENVSENRRDTLKQAYISYLHSQFDDLYEESYDEEQKRRFVSMCVNKEKLIHFDLDEEAKSAFLIKDANYVSLETISLELARLAAEKKTTGRCNPARTEREYRQEIETLIDSVSEVFRYSAERVASEALVDLNYIFGISEDMSYRTSVQ